jgi:hypothetical protein
MLWLSSLPRGDIICSSFVVDFEIIILREDFDIITAVGWRSGLVVGNQVRHACF